MPNKMKSPISFAPYFHKRPKEKNSDGDIGFVKMESWGLTDQAFSMQDVDGWQYHWNVTRAQSLAEGSGQVFRFRPADYGITLELVKHQYLHLDADYALTTDLTRPVLLTLFARHLAKDEEPNTLQLLDGWHRLYKALLTGVEVLPAYLLTQEQSQSVLFALLPPGKGIDWGQSQKGEKNENKSNDRSHSR